MRTITKTYEIYTFNELSDEAKEKVRQHYFDDPALVEIFTEMVEQDLQTLFPHSNMSVEYSLTYSQGDGLNIYGELTGSDALEYIKSDLDNQVIADMNLIISDITLKLDPNDRYAYCIVDRQDFEYQILSIADDEAEYFYQQSHNNANGDLNWEDYSEAAARRSAFSDTFESSVHTFCEVLKSKLIQECSTWEDEGYKYFYEIEDEELAERYDGYEFFADGTMA